MPEKHPTLTYRKKREWLLKPRKPVKEKRTIGHTLSLLSTTGRNTQTSTATKSGIVAAHAIDNSSAAGANKMPTATAVAALPGVTIAAPLIALEKAPSSSPPSLASEEIKPGSATAEEDVVVDDDKDDDDSPLSAATELALLIDGDEPSAAVGAAAGEGVNARSLAALELPPSVASTVGDPVVSTVGEDVASTPDPDGATVVVRAAVGARVLPGNIVPGSDGSDSVEVGRSVGACQIQQTRVGHIIIVRPHQLYRTRQQREKEGGWSPNKATARCEGMQRI